MTDERTRQREHEVYQMIEALLHQAVDHLIETTPGAVTLADIGRIRQAPWADLLAAEAGLPREVVRAVTGG
jgi:hypothetical protein